MQDEQAIAARERDRCIRVLVHLTTDRTRAELHHVYLHGAVSLRDDLPE